MSSLELRDLMFNLIPSDGTLIGNVSLRKAFFRKLVGTSHQPENRDSANRLYWRVREDLLDLGLVKKGRGKGGSVKRTHVMPQAGPLSAPLVPAGMKHEETTVLESPSEGETRVYNICGPLG